MFYVTEINCHNKTFHHRRGGITKQDKCWKKHYSEEQSFSKCHTLHKFTICKIIDKGLLSHSSYNISIQISAIPSSPFASFAFLISAANHQLLVKNRRLTEVVFIPNNPPYLAGDTLGTKCIRVVSWDEPKCFGTLDLRPGFRKKFDLWFIKQTSKYATKCEDWKKAGYSVNGDVRSKEKCYSKQYAPSVKFQKCLTFYTYHLCLIKNGKGTKLSK